MSRFASGCASLASLAFGFLLALAVLLVVQGCAPVRAPREQARSVVLTIAEGVRQGDLACAGLALAKRSVALAESCAAIVDEARAQLILAEDGVDAWDAAAVDNLPCAVLSAGDALGRLLTLTREAGGKIPPAVDDALRLVPVLAGACRRG